MARAAEMRPRSAQIVHVLQDQAGEGDVQLLPGAAVAVAEIAGIDAGDAFADVDIEDPRLVLGAQTSRLGLALDPAGGGADGPGPPYPPEGWALIFSLPMMR
jgi:hypothetical protein